MLFSYKLDRPISESEAVTSVGQLWVSKFRNKEALPNDYKLPFLAEAGLKFLAPQSFYAEGLARELTRNGPLWFTIDLEEGSHASILTGMFLNEDSKEYWVSYIDPLDGELKADTFDGFMRRYEAPAWRETKPGPTMTFRDLFIQVVHL